MKQEKMIRLPARKGIPETSIYTEIHTKTGHLDQRDVLMLMPGGPGNEHTVCDYAGKSFADELLPHVDVILFDPRGCGKSSKSPIEYCTLEHYIEDVESIREHFKIPSSRYVLIGVSYGAMAALGYGVKYSPRLKKLILVCGAVSGEFIEEAKKNLAKIGTPAQQKMGNAILNGAVDFSSGYYDTMGPTYSYLFEPGMPTPNIAFNAELFNLGFSKFLREFDYRPKLSQVTCQTLIIAGDGDWICDINQAKSIHHGISGSKLIIYQDCKHMIWIDQREKFLHDITDFLTH